MLYLAFIGRDRNATTHCLAFTFFFARLSWVCFHFHGAYVTFFFAANVEFILVSFSTKATTGVTGVATATWLALKPFLSILR